MAHVAITETHCVFSVGSFLFSVLDCALMMAVLQFSRGQLSLADLVRSSDSHGRSGARSGGTLLVRPALPHLRCADDRSDCRSDRSCLSHGHRPTSQLTTAVADAGKPPAAVPPIDTGCVLYSKAPPGRNCATRNLGLGLWINPARD